MYTKIILIFISIIAICGCGNIENTKIITKVPRNLFVVDELGNPLNEVILGVEAPIPFVNQRTNKNGIVRIGRRSLFPNGYVLLSKNGYDSYFEHCDNTPDKVVLKLSER